MKPITRSALLSRPFPALCLLACCLLLPTPPAFAENTSNASGVQTAFPEQASTPEQALLEELAARTRDRALFAAGIAPEIARILRNAPDSYRNETPDTLVDSLWALRSRPEMRKEWLDKLAAPGQTRDQYRQWLYKFEEFMRNARHKAERIARHELSNRNLWTWFRWNLLDPDSSGTLYQRTLYRLEQAKALEKAFAGVLVLVDTPQPPAKRVRP